MPYVPGLTLTDGTTISWTQIETLRDGAISWLNTIPTADIADEAIDRLQIVEPLVAGYPLQRMDGEAQSAGWGEYGDDSPPGEHREAWGARPQRLLISPPLVPDTFRTILGFTVHVPEHPGVAHEMEIRITGAAQIRHELVADGGPSYPTGGGLGDFAGYLAIERYTHSTGEREVYTDGACLLYPQEITAAVTSYFYNDRVDVLGHWLEGDALTGGETYTFTLLYVRDTCPKTVKQIDLSELRLVWCMN